jgi:hypothetical protein
MFIELNAFCSHGKHWFDESSDIDIKTLHKWQNGGTEFYDNLINVWTHSDVEKRETARKNNLNYVVFWSDKLNDVLLWFKLGCPDGHDYDIEYSWVPSHTM